MRNLQSAASGVFAGYSGQYPGGNEKSSRAAYACAELLCGEDDRDGAVARAYYNVIYLGIVRRIIMGKNREQQHLQVGGPAGVGVSFTL